MKKRDTAFLMIGFGVGVSVMKIAVLIMLSHMFIFGVAKKAALLIFASPLLLVFGGAWLLYPRRRQV